MAFKQTIETAGKSFPDAYIKVADVRLNLLDMRAEIVFFVFQSEAASDTYKAAILAGETPNPSDFNCGEARVYVGGETFTDLLQAKDIRALAYDLAATQPEFASAESV